MFSLHNLLFKPKKCGYCGEPTTEVGPLRINPLDFDELWRCGWCYDYHYSEHLKWTKEQFKAYLSKSAD